MKESPSALRPIAFMVMPFRERAVPNPPPGAPTRLDCDALWDRAFRPALEELGYLAIRADSEIGSVIIKDMLERLALAELVIADLSLPNGNVYYEIGMRHVAKKTHCILVAAEWSQQLFDMDQMRSDRYPLKDGSVPEEEAAVIKQFLLDIIPKKKDAPTPYYEFVTSKADSTVFRAQVQSISDFQAEVAAIRQLRNPTDRADRVRALHSKFSVPTSTAAAATSALNLPEVALELLTLVRDVLGWQELMAYVKTLPDTLQDRPFTREQFLLAQSKSGDHEDAIAGLEQLNALYGPTPERYGLIGGRYKQLWRQTRKARIEQGTTEPDFIEAAHLDASIQNYTAGMQLDLNEYYCASNLPGLLRSRITITTADADADADAEEAAFLDKLIVRSCTRKIESGQDDGWARPTLLGAAFRVADLGLINKLATQIVSQGAEAWQLDSTLDDIDDTIATVQDESTRNRLGKVRDQLRTIAANNRPRATQPEEVDPDPEPPPT